MSKEKSNTLKALGTFFQRSVVDYQRMLTLQHAYRSGDLPDTDRSGVGLA